MAGIYIHIPFCKTRCIYCDFFSSTLMNKKTQYVKALCKELELRKDYLEGKEIQTIYLGGGTPSLLSANDFEKIFTALPLNPLKGTLVPEKNEINYSLSPLFGVVSDYVVAKSKSPDLQILQSRALFLTRRSQRLRRTFKGEEITLEVNPDDITPEYLESLKNLPFNRISIGIQSFNDVELRFLNRRHNAQKAFQTVKMCKDYGF